MRNFLPLILLASIALFANPASAQSASNSCTELDTLPATITVGGNYCLKKNFAVNNTTGNSITINANDVTLDCQNHTIRSTAASNAGSSNGVYALNRKNVTIQNCRLIGGFTNGINVNQNNSLANQSYYINILNNYIAGAYWHGILAYGSGIEIRENRVYDVGGQLNTYAMGIRVQGSTLTDQFRYHHLERNLVAGINSPYQHAYGIYSENSLASMFWHNEIVGTTASNTTYRSYGFRVGGSVNQITDNRVIGSPLSNNTGILTVAGGGDCYDNTIKANLATSGCDATLGNY